MGYSNIELCVDMIVECNSHFKQPQNQETVLTHFTGEVIVVLLLYHYFVLLYYYSFTILLLLKSRD